MKRMKERIRKITRWLLRLSVCILALSTSGCFTAMSHFMGAQPSTSEKIVAGTLDVATFPVQAVVFGPMVVGEWVDENTGEGARLKQRAKERTALREKLKADFSLIYANPDYLASTNTVAREAVEEYFRYHGYNGLKREDVVRLAEITASRHELAETLSPIWWREGIPLETRMKAVAAIEIGKADHRNPQALIRHVMGHDGVADTELARIAAQRDVRPIAAAAAAEILEERRRKRERDAKLEAERKAWQEKMRAKEEAERRRRAEEERRQREVRLAEILKHNEEMRRVAKNIWSEDGGFAEVVENVNDDIVRRVLSRALYDKSRPVPEANLKMLVDSALSGGPCNFQVLRFALKRPELSAETLCGYYDDLVKLQLEQERSEFMTGYLANPNLPRDILRRAWREPSLSECRNVYFVHRVYLDEAKSERAKAELDELARERDKKNLKRAEWTKRLDRILKKYLPKDAPEDWTKAMP